MLLKVPQHVSDEDPVFNRTLRALKSHPNARQDDVDDDDDDDNVEAMMSIMMMRRRRKGENVSIFGGMIFAQIILIGGRLFLTG